MARDPYPVMILVAEHKLADFISPPTPDGMLEASGVIAKGADYYVVFDNVRRIARIDRGLEPGSKRHSWFGRTRDGEGYEDFAFRRHTRRFYLLIEAENIPTAPIKRSSTSATSPGITNIGGGSTLRSRSATPVSRG